MKFNDTLQKLLGSEDLTFDEAKNAMEEIMTGKVSEVKLSAWLTALRMKGESPEEIAGCASAMREHAKAIKCEDIKAVDMTNDIEIINIKLVWIFICVGL